MTRLATGLLIGFVLGLAAPAAAQHDEWLNSGRRIMLERQERFDRWQQQMNQQRELSELQQLRQEIQRQGLEQQQRFQTDRWRRFLNDD